MKGGVKRDTLMGSVLYHFVKDSFGKQHTLKHCQTICVQRTPSYTTVHHLKHKNTRRNVSLLENLKILELSGYLGT